MLVSAEGRSLVRPTEGCLWLKYFEDILLLRQAPWYKSAASVAVKARVAKAICEHDWASDTPMTRWK